MGKKGRRRGDSASGEVARVWRSMGAVISSIELSSTKGGAARAHKDLSARETSSLANAEPDRPTQGSEPVGSRK